MATATTVEERLATLEAEVTKLKQIIAHEDDLLLQLVGTMKEIPPDTAAETIRRRRSLREAELSSSTGLHYEPLLT